MADANPVISIIETVSVTAIYAGLQFGINLVAALAIDAWCWTYVAPNMQSAWPTISDVVVWVGTEVALLSLLFAADIQIFMRMGIPDPASCLMSIVGILAGAQTLIGAGYTLAVAAKAEETVASWFGIDFQYVGLPGTAATSSQHQSSHTMAEKTGQVFMTPRSGYQATLYNSAVAR